MKAKDTAKRNKYYHCLEYDHDQVGDICLVACGMEQCDPGVDYGPEVRDCYHLHIVLSGTGTLYAGGKTLHPRSGQMFLLKHNEMVRYTADSSEPWKYCWVTYNGTEAKRLSEDIGFTDGVYCLDSAIEAKEFFELIRRMHEKPEMNYINDLRRRGILLEFLALALEATETPSRKLARRYEYPAEVYVRKAVDFIHYNYATINVSDIVEYIGFTRSYFTTIFKRQVGVSPQKYLLKYRLQQGCSRLLSTGLEIQDIAAQVGYDDPLNFSKMFKNTYGVSPTEYRLKGGRI
ncbi:MAG: AraC family transcriptional regulator [Eubacteriales bacterium]|nr:AraC family transcriptional regulator [Eubacteriales bacterium]